MLPKPDKKSKSPEQLDLVKTLDQSAKIESKRRYVIILLILFVGSSFIFYIYAQFKRLSVFSLKPDVDINFSLPKIDFSQDNFNSQIDSLVLNNSWSISLFAINSPDITSVYDYNSSHLTYNLSDIIKNLSQSTPFKDSPIINSLPQGLEYTENISTQNDYLEHQLLLNLPNQQKYLLITRSNSPDTSYFRSLLPKIVELIYWSKVTNPPN